MTPDQLQEGRAYYRVTYADPGLTIPGVRPMIYIGSNIFPDDDPSTVTYYFQDTLSYFTCGSALDPRTNDAHPEIEVRLFPHAAAELGSGIGDLDTAIAALQDARWRLERQ